MNIKSIQKYLCCKKRCSPFKIRTGGKSCEIKGGGQEMAVMVNNDNLGEYVASCTNSPELPLLNF